jgi:hypothetical protein
MEILSEEDMEEKRHDFMRPGLSFVKVKFLLFSIDKYRLLILLSL